MTDRPYREPDDRRYFRFHKILKKVVDRYGEGILTDYGIVDIIRDMPNEEVQAEVLNVLERIIYDEAVNEILDHETNSWDDDLETFYTDYATEVEIDVTLAIRIARCIAYSIGMDVEVIPFKSRVTHKTRTHIYTIEELQPLIYCINSSPITIYLANMYQDKENIGVSCYLESSLTEIESSEFRVNVRVARVNDQTVLSESSDLLPIFRNNDIRHIIVPFSRVLTDKDGVSRIEISVYIRKKDTFL